MLLAVSYSLLAHLRDIELSYDIKIVKGERKLNMPFSHLL